ncbi:MAG: pyridoxal-dependent decarboxylase [Candidatus Limnocylindrales bacterium]
MPDTTLTQDPAAPDDTATADLLRWTAEQAIAWRTGLGERHVGADPSVTPASLRDGLGGPLPRTGTDPRTVIDDLVRAADPGLVAMSGPRYHGFVIGGSVPSALAADWLTSTWDQNAGGYLVTPSAAIVEEVAGAWLVELLGLPVGTSVGFATGATLASTTCLAAGRHAVLRKAGWDVEEDGLQGAPTVRVIVGTDVHVSVLMALRYLGFGRGRAERVPTDDQGRMDPGALAAMLEGHTGPLIVCAQAGEVNTGAFDPMARIVEVVRRVPDAWLHLDGAFGLWAAASPRLRHLVVGHDGADSWATDGHKWLNVPYDSGFAFVRDAAAHRAAMGSSAAYLPPAPAATRDPWDYVPELSRRARGFTAWAAIRELGAAGIAALVERDHDLAVRMADRLARHPGVTIANEVVLNQVLVGLGDPDLTRDVAARVQREGTTWFGTTVFKGTPWARISVSSWWTTEDDIDRSADAILRCLDEALAARRG